MDYMCTKFSHSWCKETWVILWELSDNRRTAPYTFRRKTDVLMMITLAACGGIHSPYLHGDILPAGNREHASFSRPATSIQFMQLSEVYVVQPWCDLLRAKMSLRLRATRSRSCFGVWHDVWQNLQYNNIMVGMDKHHSKHQTVINTAKNVDDGNFFLRGIPLSCPLATSSPQ